MKGSFSWDNTGDVQCELNICNDNHWMTFYNYLVQYCSQRMVWLIPFDCVINPDGYFIYIGLWLHVQLKRLQMEVLPSEFQTILIQIIVDHQLDCVFSFSNQLSSSDGVDHAGFSSSSSFPVFSGSNSLSPTNTSSNLPSTSSSSASVSGYGFGCADLSTSMPSMDSSTARPPLSGLEDSWMRTFHLLCAIGKMRGTCNIPLKVSFVVCLTFGLCRLI